MAEVPSDVSWPPGSDLDFDDILDVLKELRTIHFPEHTAEDLADPFIQIMCLMAAMKQHAVGKANQALSKLDLTQVVSRRAMIALVDPLNRPLRPIQPSRGTIYARLKAAPVINTVMMSANMRIAQPGITDPSFSVDEDVSTGSSIDIEVWHLAADGTATAQALPASAVSFDVGDSIVFGSPDLMFDQVDVLLNGNKLPSGHQIAWEYRNDESGEPDDITEDGGTLEFELGVYLNSLGTAANGLEVTITHKSTNVSETVVIESNTAVPIAITSYLGQAVPSLVSSDYEVFASWRPIPNVSDGTVALGQDGTVSWSMSSVKSKTNEWVKDDVFGWAIRGRLTDPSNTSVLPDTIDILQPTNSDGDWYVQAGITQGYRRDIAIGQTDGTKFQFMTIAIDVIDEPVYDPVIDVKVGTDTEWFVVEDFSDSEGTSKHAILREDPDDGWGIFFGDGTYGMLPANGSSVVISIRTGSTQPGDLASNTVLKTLGGPGLVTDIVLYRSCTGFEPPEGSDYDSVLRFRHAIVPQLALRTESVVSPPEIVTALSGGAPNRATFTTSDGRKPFSRAFYSVEGAGDRQYRMIVVGSESDPAGAVDSNDTAEAETWLNGTEVGIQIIGGHGPQNTQGIVSAFVPRYLRPTVTMYVTSSEGVRAQVQQIVTNFFSPHSRDEHAEFRWDFGGKVPMAVLFGLLWEHVPNRSFIEISVADGLTSYGPGDYVQLERFELPVLSALFDRTTDIIISVV